MNNLKDFKKTIKDNFEAFLDLIFPRNIYCIMCGMPINKNERYSICSPCRDKIKFIVGRRCLKCGKPLDEIYIPDKCPECINNKFYFKKALSCVEYNEYSKKIIYGLKYMGKKYFSYHMAEIMADYLKELDGIRLDLVISIPLHKRKERERGFNQSYLIGKYLSSLIDVPIDKTTLIRIKDTLEQNKLTKEERRENLKNAFKVLKNNNIINKNILLVDDVFTTGTTVNEAAKVLKNNGARDIYVITFAAVKNI